MRDYGDTALARMSCDANRMPRTPFPILMQYQDAFVLLHNPTSAVIDNSGNVDTMRLRLPGGNELLSPGATSGGGSQAQPQGWINPGVPASLLVAQQLDANATADPGNIIQQTYNNAIDVGPAGCNCSFDSSQLSSVLTPAPANQPAQSSVVADQTSGGLYSLGTITAAVGPGKP